MPTVLDRPGAFLHRQNWSLSDDELPSRTHEEDRDGEMWPSLRLEAGDAGGPQESPCEIGLGWLGGLEVLVFRMYCLCAADLGSIIDPQMGVATNAAHRGSMKTNTTIKHIGSSTHGMFRITTVGAIILIYNNEHQVRASVMRQPGPDSRGSWFDQKPALMNMLSFTLGARGEMVLADGSYLYGASTWSTSEVRSIERIQFTRCYRCGRRTFGQRRPFCLRCAIDRIRFDLHMRRISGRPRKRRHWQ